MNPGGFSPDARDIFSEGFSSPGVRIVQAGEVCDDVLDTLLNMSALAGYGVAGYSFDDRLQ